MKKITIPFVAIVLLLATGACGNKSENVVLANQTDTLSWAMGMSLAETAKTQYLSLDQKKIKQAFESFLNGEKQPLDEKTYREICQFMAFTIAQHQKEESKKNSQTANVRQKEYFDKLVKEKGDNLKKSKEGFYYEVLTAGSGARAKEGERIKFDFHSFNALTGETITKTYGNRESIVHVISSSMFTGLFNGLQLMPAGSKYRFYFPYELCQNVGDIPPHTPVIYEVELHEIYKD